LAHQLIHFITSTRASHNTKQHSLPPYSSSGTGTLHHCSTTGHFYLTTHMHFAFVLSISLFAVMQQAGASSGPDVAVIVSPSDQGNKPDGMVRFVCISDTHGHHRELDLPHGDVLLHAGDMTQHGLRSEMEDFNKWLGEIAPRFKHIIVIGGNHDLSLEADLKQEGKEPLLTNCVLLNQQSFSVFGIKIYGSSVEPRIGRKYIAFVRNKAELEEAWNRVPSDTDIILSHGPPRGHGDRMWGIKQAGDDSLLRACERVKPKAVVFGHIHAGYGVTQMNDGGTACINAASMRPLRFAVGLNTPIVFDLSPKSTTAAHTSDLSAIVQRAATTTTVTDFAPPDVVSVVE
jgi:Icc-related predicted phosphoesterase